jgi:hypothetical protein
LGIYGTGEAVVGWIISVPLILITIIISAMIIKKKFIELEKLKKER